MGTAYTIIIYQGYNLSLFLSDHLNFLASIIENVTLELHHLESKLRLTQSIISDINLLAK